MRDEDEVTDGAVGCAVLFAKIAASIVVVLLLFALLWIASQIAGLGG